MSAERKVFGRLQGMAETPPDLIEMPNNPEEFGELQKVEEHDEQDGVD